MGILKSSLPNEELTTGIRSVYCEDEHGHLQASYKRKMERQFDSFVAAIPGYLAELSRRLSEAGIEVNLSKTNGKYADDAFSDDTVDAVEEFFCGLAGWDAQAAANLQLHAEAFIGEACCHRTGGRWALCSNKRDQLFGTPTIVDWGEGAPISPGRLVAEVVTGNKVGWRENLRYFDDAAGEQDRVLAFLRGEIDAI